MEPSATTGSCLCGSVAFSITPPYKAFQYCHCSRCQKTTGSPHAANIFVSVAQFAWTRGDEHIRRHELATAQYFCTGTCAVCGGRLPWVTRNGKLMIVPAGTLDSDPGIRPTRNVHVASAAAWEVCTAELESFDEEPPR